MKKDIIKRCGRIVKTPLIIWVLHWRWLRAAAEEKRIR
jgi:hypothetical protein